MEIRSGIKISPIKEGVVSDLEMMFPYGTACFRVQGGTRFNHGGASLQEVIIPCMLIESAGEQDMQQLNIKVTYPDKISNSIFKLEIFPLFSTLHQIKGRTIEIKVLKNDVEVSELAYCEVESTPIKQLVKLNPSITTGTVVIKIQDFNTKEVLSQK